MEWLNASKRHPAKMSTSDAGGKTGSESRKRRGPTLWRAWRVQTNEELSAADAASTLFRFFRSKHVGDLKLAANLALILLVCHIVLVLAYSFIPPTANSASPNTTPSANSTPPNTTPSANSAPPNSNEIEKAKEEKAKSVALWNMIAHIFEVLSKYVGPAITIYGAIVAWAYLSASKRLGIIDLFACEIKTLCRVGTIFDVGKSYVAMYQNSLDIAENRAATESIPAAQSAAKPVTDELLSRSSVSQEHYFPVFDNNSSDLESLEALLVGYITEYYTYMKAVRDLQRVFASIDASQAAKSGAGAPYGSAKVDAWHETVADIIYVLFLGYESARNAIADLIEFQPTRDENIIVILMTELVCFSFLCEYLREDSLRFMRLELRELGYEKVYGELFKSVNGPHNKENEEYWRPVQRMFPELQERYKAAMDTLQRYKQ
jgi:hypothetical protein